MRAAKVQASMDIEFDSDLSDVSEVEVDEAGPIQPYQYEPRRNTPEESTDSEEEQSDSSTSTDDEDGRPAPGVIIPDVSTWWGDFIFNCVRFSYIEFAS